LEPGNAALAEPVPRVADASVAMSITRQVQCVLVAPLNTVRS
jgi:hypothetical protein